VTIRQYDDERTGDQWRVMKHGWIEHGRQFTDPDRRRWPTYTFGRRSGIGQAIGYLNQNGSLRVGIVGLGIGTLATYARAGDEYRFYEINPEVLRLARKHFTCLDDCRGKWDVVLGDGRLALEREPPQHFNLLVLDAFSGDAVPTHMLTREAFEVYRRHLAPGGVIAVHITNTYLHLAPVVRALAENCGLDHVRVYSDGDANRLQYHSDWMLLTSNENFLRAIPAAPPEEVCDDFTVPLWTDHYSNLFQILKGAAR
jgi:spermidine synthase